jgi:SPP1 gp7 family putative phage head morphogenesis protein
MTWAAPAKVDRFDEAVDWFMARTVMTKDQVKRLEPANRQDAFWVGAGLQADQVQRVQDEITKAIESGEPFEDWRKRVRNDLFSDAHAETVFRNATQRSYNAGRWEQMQDPEVAKFRPYLVFDAILDDRTTTICEACNETILHREDPWWGSHIPPLHHRCRSSIRSLREAEAKRQGITTEPTEDAPGGDWGAPPAAGNGWRPDKDRYEKRIAAEIERKRLLREAPAPATPHAPDEWAKKYQDRYGEAAPAVGWGKASYETGMDLPIKEVRQQLQRLPATEATRAMLGSLEGAEGTLRRSGGELDPIRRAAAGTAGHLKAIPDRPPIKASGLPARGTGKRAQDFFTEMTGPDMVHPEDFVFELKSTRAGAAPWAKYIRYRSAPGVLEHEWAHSIEYLNPKLQASSLAFREARTRGERLTQIEGQNPGELGKEDDFLNHYIGKVYSDPQTANSTEITSMGVELLAGGTGWGKLEQLLKRDPEHFFFVLGQLAGR